MAGIGRELCAPRSRHWQSGCCCSYTCQTVHMAATARTFQRCQDTCAIVTRASAMMTLGGWHLSCYGTQANEPQQAFVIEYAINDIIRVQCDTAAPYQTAFFQNFSVSEVERFAFSYCTMPNGSFAQVLEGLDVTSLQLVSCEIGDTLDARLFEGLDKLKRLTVTGSKDLRFIPEDTFTNLTTLVKS
ncbi:hypothetical protein MRX96_037643 [Rhipicephalus microplus]